MKQLIARELPRLIEEDAEIRALVLSCARTIETRETSAQDEDPTGDASVLILHCDGASRGNPGPASLGFVIREAPGEQPIRSVSKYLGRKTNNEAEYMALITGIEEALKLGSDTLNLKIHMDSELVVKQIRGEYRVKNENLKPLHAKAKELLKRVPGWSIVHVRREQNQEADRLANEAFENRRE